MIQAPLLRVRIVLRSPLGTPLTSGTIFGHLCWGLRNRAGEAFLHRWLEQQGDAPTLVSDGFPAGLLPRPVLAPPVRRLDLTPEAAQKAKAIARFPWVTVDGFCGVRAALSPSKLDVHLRQDPWTVEQSDMRLAHNRIDRLTGTTPKEAGLFFVDEDWSYTVSPERDIYVRSVMLADELGGLFAEIGKDGFGRDATVGRGRFDVLSVAPVAELDAAEGSRWLSLSHGTITSQMGAPRYRTMTHFGKLGEVAARSGARPWKRPLLLARPGATFAASGAGPFGTLLSGVHQEAAWVRHDARHVAIRYTEVEER